MSSVASADFLQASAILTTLLEVHLHAIHLQGALLLVKSIANFTGSGFAGGNFALRDFDQVFYANHCKPAFLPSKRELPHTNGAVNVH